MNFLCSQMNYTISNSSKKQIKLFNAHSIHIVDIHALSEKTFKQDLDSITCLHSMWTPSQVEKVNHLYHRSKSSKLKNRTYKKKELLQVGVEASIFHFFPPMRLNMYLRELMLLVMLVCLSACSEELCDDDQGRVSASKIDYQVLFLFN